MNLRSIFRISFVLLFLITTLYFVDKYILESTLDSGVVFEELALGEIVQLERMDASPVITFGKSKVVYLWGNRFKSQKGVTPSSINDLSELPFFYDSIQIVLDDEGALMAKAWCGEGLEIHTKFGLYRGNTLTSLPDSIEREFSQL